MKEKKKLTSITVTTQPNGYELTVGHEQFFEFTEKELLEAFFTHIGLGVTKAIDRTEMANLMTSLSHYPTMMDAVTAAEKLNKENERLKNQVDKLLKEVKDLQAANREVVNLNRKKEAKPQERKSINKSEVISVSRTRKQETVPIASLSTYSMERLMVHISQTGLSSRARSIMMLIGGRANVTVLDALRSSHKEFAEARGCGKAVLEEIETYVKANGLDFGLVF